jgi:hypothetical protein
MFQDNFKLLWIVWDIFNFCSKIIKNFHTWVMCSLWSLPEEDINYLFVWWIYHGILCSLQNSFVINWKKKVYIVT